MQRVAEQQRLLGGEKEVGPVGRLCATVADEGGGPADGVGDTGDQVDRVGGQDRGHRRGRGTDRCRRAAQSSEGASRTRVGSGRLRAVVRLPREQGRDGDGVGCRGSRGGVGQVGEAEAVPAGRGPVVDGGQQGGAAGGEGDAEGAVLGGGEVVLAYPAAQQVLGGGGLGRGVGVEVFEEVGRGTARHSALPAVPFCRGTVSLSGPGASRGCRGGNGLRVRGCCSRPFLVRLFECACG